LAKLIGIQILIYTPLIMGMLFSVNQLIVLKNEVQEEI